MRLTSKRLLVTHVARESNGLNVSLTPWHYRSEIDLTFPERKKTIRVLTEYDNTNRLKYEEDQVEIDLRYSRTEGIQEDRAGRICHYGLTFISLTTLTYLSFEYVIVR